jgi:hypothetical protein
MGYIDESEKGAEALQPWEAPTLKKSAIGEATLGNPSNSGTDGTATANS